MPNNQSPYGGDALYNPFAVQNLFMPMAAQMDAQTESQINQLKEQFGAEGMRWSDSLMKAMSGANTAAANQKNQIMSDLMYQDAQNAYNRQMGAADLSMRQQQADKGYDLDLMNSLFGMDMQRAGLLGQLGGMQDSRDQQLMLDLMQMGMGQRGQANQDLAAAYQEWLRQLDYGWDKAGQFVSPGGYNSDYKQDPSWIQEWGPVIAGLLGYMNK